MPEEPQEQKDYKTKYQALRRALESMTEEGIIEPPTYRLAGELADQNYILKSILHFKETKDPAKRKFLMDDIEVECRKRDAILTPGILVFLKNRLDDEPPEVRRLAILCLSYVASNVDESRRVDLGLLKRLRNDFSSKLVEIGKNDPSLEVRMEAFHVLLIFGVSATISVIEHFVTHSPRDEFKQIKSTLMNELFRPYDESAHLKNRFLRDHRDSLRNALLDIRFRGDKFAQERAEVLHWKLRHGYANIMPDGREENLE
jgi:hypothetical protein